jgi:hypothetical protein
MNEQNIRKHHRYQGREATIGSRQTLHSIFNTIFHASHPGIYGSGSFPLESTMLHIFHPYPTEKVHISPHTPASFTLKIVTAEHTKISEQLQHCA